MKTEIKIKNEEQIRKNVSNALKELRKNENLTQVDLADDWGYDTKSISNWEQCLGLPPLKILVELSIRLNRSLNDILCVNVNENPKGVFGDCLTYLINITNEENISLETSDLKDKIINHLSEFFYYVGASYVLFDKNCGNDKLWLPEKYSNFSDSEFKLASNFSDNNSKLLSNVLDIDIPYIERMDYSRSKSLYFSNFHYITDFLCSEKHIVILENKIMVSKQFLLECLNMVIKNEKDLSNYVREKIESVKKELTLLEQEHEESVDFLYENFKQDEEKQMQQNKSNEANKPVEQKKENNTQTTSELTREQFSLYVDAILFTGLKYSLEKFKTKNKNDFIKWVVSDKNLSQEELTNKYGKFEQIIQNSNLAPKDALFEYCGNLENALDCGYDTIHNLSKISDILPESMKILSNKNEELKLKPDDEMFEIFVIEEKFLKMSPITKMKDNENKKN